MRVAAVLCLLVIVASLADAKKSFSTRRKSGGNSRRGQTSHKQPQQVPGAPGAPGTPHRADTGASTSFLNSERAGSSSSSANTHYRGNPFDNPKQHQPSAPQPAAPHSNPAPIGFEKVQQPQGGQKLGFDRVNSEVQHKPASVPSAPAYPGAQGGAYPGKAPNGPPPAYPGQGAPGSGAHGGYEAPPAYPGRPVDAPPVYSHNAPNYPQRSPGVGGYPHQQQQGGFPQQNNPYSHQQQQGGFPQQNNPYPQQQWSQPGQHNYGYPGAGGNFPNQGYQQGYGSYQSAGGFGGYGNNQMGGGYGQSYPGYGGGNPYGVSPFGHSNQYGGSPFSSPMGGGGFGGFGGGNSYGGFGQSGYSPNNFGYSSKPGLFGSLFGGGHSNSPYGYHKRSRFGGLPIPIPIPIPIPMGLFGGRSHNHRVLDTFIKNQTVNESDNSTAVYVLNNATFTPCTTDQFIYDSLNVTVMSCTAENCTAIKVFTTTNVSGEVAVRSAGITVCMEDDDTTYSSFADNVNPTVYDLHKYLTRVCKEVVVTGDATGTAASQNVSVKITQTVLEENVNETATEQPAGTSPTPQPVESSTIRTLVDSTSSATNASSCETFNCSRIEMCLPAIEIADRCAAPDCPFTRTGYKPCVTVRMCRSPTTAVSAFATLNNTLSRIDQFNNVTSVNDVANLTLISYIPAEPPVNCSDGGANSTCPGAGPPVPAGSEPPAVVPPEGAPATGAPESVPVSGVPPAGECAPGQPSLSADGVTSSPPCTPPPQDTTVTSDADVTSSPATTESG